jgi:chemotaxis receptor (MCP) glutamine deamidase CheD
MLFKLVRLDNHVRKNTLGSCIYACLIFTVNSAAAMIVTLIKHDSYTYPGVYSMQEPKRWGYWILHLASSSTPSHQGIAA